jgi:bile acid-coenzyme A ligase
MTVSRSSSTDSPMPWPSSSAVWAWASATWSRWRCPTGWSGSSPSWPCGSWAPPPTGQRPASAPRARGRGELADPVVVLGVDPDLLPGRVCLPVDYQPPDPEEPVELPDVVSPAWKAPTSGGSTGRPKLIVSGDPGLIDPSVDAALLFSRDGCLVMPGPLYHNGPIVWCVFRPAARQPRRRPTPLRCRSDVGGHGRAPGRRGVPGPHHDETHLEPPGGRADSYDLSALRVVWHLAEPCPPWLKEAWIDWLGPERIFELYAGTEAQLRTVITGTEWLEHRGSVGRPAGGEVQICDPDGTSFPRDTKVRYGCAPPVDTGLPVRRGRGPGPTRRLGVARRHGLARRGRLPLPRRPGPGHDPGGWIQCLPGRNRVGLERAPHVRSCAVIGLPDDDRGNRVHAIVEADPGR